ncbi:MAG: DUF4124 domain-containing protein [Rhodanobacteraceae bacterium]
MALSIAACTLAHAEGQLVHRCIGAQGEIVFSGLPCGTPAPSAAPSTSASTALAARTAPVNCPASVETLRTLISEALARRDANAIAGVMRWDGVGGAAARQRMKDIAELAERPMLGIDTSGGEISPDALSPAAPVEGDEPAQRAPESSATILTVRTGGSEDGGSREHEFGIVRSEGCYWLDW